MNGFLVVVYILHDFVPIVIITMRLSYFYTSDYNDRFNAIFYHRAVSKMSDARHIRH